MTVRYISRLLLAGLLAGSALLAPAPQPGGESDTPQLIVGYPVAHADGPNDWPMYGHDPAHTGYNPDETQLKPPLRLKWSYTTGDRVYSSPAATGGVVYVGSFALDRKVYALDAQSGALRWSYTVGDFVTTSPAVANGVVYVSCNDWNVYALEAATGALRWKYKTGGVVTSPVVTDGVLYVGSYGGKVYALDAATGALRWSYTAGSAVGSSPVVANGLVYVGSSDGTVYALDAGTGTLNWSYQTASTLAGNEWSPAVAGGVVYFGTSLPQSKVYALDAANGTLRWSYQAGSGLGSAPAVANGVVYIGAMGGQVLALDAASGALRWSHALGLWTRSSPAVVNGVVYVGSQDGKLYALNAGTGSLVWSYTTGGEVQSSPAVVNGVVYVGSFDHKVYAFEAQPPPVSVQSPAPYQTSASFPISWTVPVTWTGTASNSYDVQYRDGPSVAWTDLITATTALSTTFTGTQDGHTYSFRARSRTATGALGDWSEPVTTTVDLTPPSGSIQAQGWSSPYISNTVTLSVSASDSTSGLSQMQFGPDGLTFNPWEPYGTTSLYLAPAGATAVYGRFKDNAGNVSQTVSATIALDNVSPTGSVSISGGATYANAISTTLTLSATDNLSGISTMSLSNDGSSWSDWLGYAGSRSWSLAAGPDGPRTAYARFRDTAQNVSPVYSDTIILDTMAPAGTVTINGGASDTNSTAVTLTLAAGDSLSGMGQMSFSNDSQSYSPWEEYVTTRSWSIPGGNGSKAVYARFRDNAGNVSQPYTDTIILNTVLPSSAVSPLALYQNTAAFTVTWSGSASGSGLAAYDLQYRDGATGQWTDWITATLSTSAVFTGTEGHTYYFQSRATDLASNVEPYVGGDGHTRTTVDLTPPTGAITINGGALDTPSVSVTLVLSATDSLSGVSQAAYSNDGSSWSGWESYSPSKSWSLETGDGPKPVYARFRDAAGNVSAPVSDTIRLDTSLDAAYGFSINEGAIYTGQVTVTLSLPANPGTTQMMVSNDGGFYGAAWEPYAAYKAWAITQYGSYVIPRTVYVKYKDVDGKIYGAFSDEIILDLTAPSGSVSIEGTSQGSSIEAVGAAREPPLQSTMPHASAWGGEITSQAAAASPVTLKLSASDDVSGVGGMMVSSSPSFAAATWEPFSASKPWSLESGGRVYAVFKDNAGNASPIYAAAVSGARESLPSIALGTVHPKTGGQLASPETKTTVAFPAGAVGAKAEITLVPAVEAVQEQSTGSLRSTGKFLTLTAKAGETPVTTVSKAYTITVGYTAGDVAGIDESTLGIYWWNGSAWQKEAGSSVDTTSKTVSAAISHLSAFAMLGESSTRTVYLPVVLKAHTAGW